MKKILVAVMLGVSLLFCGGILAQNIGEPMPSLDGTEFVGEKPGTGPLANKVSFVHYHKNGECFYNVVYMICDGMVMENPVGIFDIKTKTFYLDNAPNDGIIDSVITENYPRVFEILPSCPK